MRECRFYIDAEFPDWDHVTPISVGLVAEDGDSLYVEFSDGWSLTDCSEFVCENILPLLGDVSSRLTTEDAVRSIYRWIISKTQRPVFVCDSHYDVDILSALVPKLVARYDVLRWDCQRQWDMFTAGQQAAYGKIGYKWKHHALCDARALMAGVISAGHPSSEFP